MQLYIHNISLDFESEKRNTKIIAEVAISRQALIAMYLSYAKVSVNDPVRVAFNQSYPFTFPSVIQQLVSRQKTL
jgi:hypothetical protein